MTRITGPLRLVTDKPAQVSQVRVRAQHDRPEGGGLTTTFDDVVKTTGGQVDFTALPGPAIMLLETIGGFAHTVKLLIPDKAKASLQECVEGAEALDVGDRDRLEKLAADVMAATTSARDSAATAAKHVTTTRNIVADAQKMMNRPNYWAAKTAADLSKIEKQARVGDLIHVVATGEYWEVS